MSKVQVSNNCFDPRTNVTVKEGDNQSQTITSGQSVPIDRSKLTDPDILILEVNLPPSGNTEETVNVTIGDEQN